MGESFVSFETNYKIVEYLSKEGFFDVNYPYAYVEENIYFMLHRKNITVKENKDSTQKDE